MLLRGSFALPHASYFPSLSLFLVGVVFFFFFFALSLAASRAHPLSPRGRALSCCIVVGMRLPVSVFSGVLDEGLDRALEVAIVAQHERLVELAIGKAHLGEIIQEAVPLGCLREVGRARVQVVAVLVDRSALCT